MISITPYGAAGEVTGSAYLVETGTASLLVDFGMFQGDKDDDARNVIPGRIHRYHPDAILLTHAHLDHCGRLPLLARDGYTGPIFCTDATRDLTELVLQDAAHIQVHDFERRQRLALKQGRKVLRTDEPMFDDDDVTTIMRLFRTVIYGKPYTITEGITATFHEAGHMLGSASIELVVTHGAERTTVVFSGDLGPAGFPYLRDADPPTSANIVVMESTYGDRDHKSEDQTLEEFAAIIDTAVAEKRRILVPSFAIGRSQQILYYYAKLVRQYRVPEIPIYLDSPMAIKATSIYNNYVRLYDEESSELELNGMSPLHLKNLTMLETADESRSLAEIDGPFMVIAGAGMCNAGRILHHLKNHVGDPSTDVVIVGYQARGSLGRRLVEHAQELTIMGVTSTVRARIHTLGGMSAHGGQTDLLKWLGHIMPSNPRVILTHGETEARTSLATAIKETYGVESILPEYADQLIF